MIKTSLFHVCWIENFILQCVHNSLEHTRTFFTSYLSLCIISAISYRRSIAVCPLHPSPIMWSSLFLNFLIFLKSLSPPHIFSTYLWNFINYLYDSYILTDLVLLLCLITKANKKVIRDLQLTLEVPQKVSASEFHSLLRENKLYLVLMQ